MNCSLKRWQLCGYWQIYRLRYIYIYIYIPTNHDTADVLRTSNKNQVVCDWPLQYYLTHSNQQRKMYGTYKIVKWY